MPAKYQTILWDLDGTIVDSGAGIFESFRKTFDELGVAQPTDEVLRTYVGPPLRETFTQLIGFDEVTAARALDIYRRVYHQGAALKATVYPGVIDEIAFSRSTGRINSLATSKALPGSVLVGEHFGFIQLFDFLGTADAESKRYTKTDVLTYALEGLEKMGADTDRIILIGDRIHDVEGARHHGIEVALVTWGYGNAEEWAQADYTIESPRQLRELITAS